MRYFISLSILFLFTLNSVVAQKNEKVSRYFDWPNNTDINRPWLSPNSKKLPLIIVKGNRFVSEKGDTMVFRGAAIADPDKLEQEGRWNKDLFVKLKEYGANIVRLPVHPAAWQMRTPEKFLKLLDQAVDWCTDLGMYAIIDWHSIGNPRLEVFENPENVTSQKETFEFWRTISVHFQGHNTAAFYEIFNEPTSGHGKFGRLTWTEWKNICEDIIGLIRANDPERIPLVAGLDWAYDLAPLRNEPIQAMGIAYTVHPYPHKRSKPYAPKWEEDFGFAAQRYPIVATEFGFSLGKNGMEENGEYGDEIIRYLESKGISWVCWVYDPLWKPNLLESWDKHKLTESGEFFHKVLKQLNNK